MQKRKQVFRAGYHSHSDALFDMLRRAQDGGAAAEVRGKLTNTDLYPVYDCEWVVKQCLISLVRTYDV